jgi:hypothetical protein
MTKVNVDDGIIIRIFATNKTSSDLSLSEKKILVIFSLIRAMRNHFYAESFSCNLSYALDALINENTKNAYKILHQHIKLLNQKFKPLFWTLTSSWLI